MAKSKEDKKEGFDPYAGCYGTHVGYDMLVQFLSYNFEKNATLGPRDTKFAQCVWGPAGTGKTSIINQFQNRPVTWKGTKYPGYNVSYVPLAQFEEMGDLHGMPYKCHLMHAKVGEESRWVPDIHVEEYSKNGWNLDHSVSPCTKMAPPDWVPIKPGPSIVLFDDWNRASVRIIKGIMQLLQTYSMISWSLPEGCNIVLTGNPDGSDYLVTSLDHAIVTRIKHITLKPDVSEWAVWATGAGLDPRGIAFCLKYKEAIEPMGEDKRTNLRTLSEFFRILKDYPVADHTNEILSAHAHSLLDTQTVSTMFTFFSKEAILIDPERILETDCKAATEEMKKLMTGRGDPRTDVLFITCERVYARVMQPDYKITADKVKNFQYFITQDWIPDDTRHSICRRITRKKDADAFKWVLGNAKLKDLILETLR